MRLGLIIAAVQGSWGSPPYKNDIEHHIQKIAAHRTAYISTVEKVKGESMAYTVVLPKLRWPRDRSKVRLVYLPCVGEVFMFSSA